VGDAATAFGGRTVVSGRQRTGELAATMIEPISLSFEVDCPVDRAFAVWTGGIAQWWPADHTVSGESDLTVVLEGRPGGRIFERRASGIEHDWGAVTIWEPPSRLGYTWHLNRDRSDATDVEIRFVAQGDRVTGSRSSIEAGSDWARRPGSWRGSQSRRLGDPAAALRGRDEAVGPGRRAGDSRPRIIRRRWISRIRMPPLVWSRSGRSAAMSSSRSSTGVIASS
jgi:uncharacterized protein YndB with AHSA1/START domain